MNYDYRNRERYSNLKVTKLTPAQEALWHERLAAEEARSERWRAELERIMAFTARIAAKRRIQAKITPLPLPVKGIAA